MVILFNFYFSQKTYKTMVPYDPEGALGTLTSSFLVFLGVQVCFLFLCLFVVFFSELHGISFKQLLQFTLILLSIGFLHCRLDTHCSHFLITWPE